MDGFDDVSLRWEAVCHRKQRERPLVRVFQGGILALQWQAFGVDLPHKCEELGIDIEVITVKDVHDSSWSEDDFVKYFLQADAHFILAHPHQGKGIQALDWNMDTLKSALIKLWFHKGFPSLEELECPVFLQDKFKYLCALGDMSNPTMQIYLTEDGSYETYLDRIRRYNKFRLFMWDIGLICSFCLALYTLIVKAKGGC